MKTGEIKAGDYVRCTGDDGNLYYGLMKVMFVNDKLRKYYCLGWKAYIELNRDDLIKVDLKGEDPIGRLLKSGEPTYFRDTGILMSEFFPSFYD